MKRIGLVNVRQYNRVYKKVIKELGHQPVLFDIYVDDLAGQIQKIDKKVDLYYWQSIDRGIFYRKAILDPVYFVENFSKHKIFPDFNQVFSFNDKIKQLHMFEYHKIPSPKGFYTYDRKKAEDFVNKAKYPFVLKDPHSSSCLAVYLIKSKTQAHQMIRKIFSKKGYRVLRNIFYVQEFIPNLDRCMRVIVIGDKTYCAYWRISPDDWKHHVGPGSHVSDKDIPRSATRLCERVSRKLGFHWMAYDVVIDRGTPKLIEFSCNFGVHGAESLGYNPRKEIIKYAVKHS
jgi:glutathione synthase/RimK-type ligase-like ATP-grasp enzyme